MPLPNFRTDGYLPVGVHKATESEVLFRFGSQTRRRRTLALRLRRWLELARAVEVSRFLVGGSFVTAKPQPHDLDAVVLLPVDFEQQVQAGNEPAVELYRIASMRRPVLGRRRNGLEELVPLFQPRSGHARPSQGSCGDLNSMINDMREYEDACKELRYLETWLNRLQKEYPGSGKGLTKVGIRKMIARIHDELGTFEASLKVDNASIKK